MSISSQAPSPTPADPAAMTRDCVDPWTYVEIGAAGNIRPCCKFRPLAKLDATADVGSVRNNEKFRALRQGLLSGQLDPICKTCHFRKSVPTRVLQRRVNAAARRAGETDVLKPLPINLFRIDINEKCNLRCDYCMVSSPTYKGVEMEGAVFDRAVALLDGIEPKAEVHVNGHGETTFHPQWMQMCKRIIDRGFRPYIITNLAKKFSDEEVELLSRFAVVQISLDSDDGEMMRKIRKAVRVDAVFETIERIREAARRARRRVPKFTFSVGIYDPSIWTLESFVDRIIRQGPFGLTFWDIVEYPHQTLVKSLDRLDPQQKRRAREILSRISRKLDIAGVDYDFAGDFHAMVPTPTAIDYVRKGLGFAYSFTTQYLFSRDRFAFARRP